MKELSIIQQKLKAPKDQNNAFGKYKYRKASDILEAVKPLLAEANLSILLDDEVQILDGKAFLIATATLVAEDGGKIAATRAFAQMDEHKGMSAEQATGAASSYARKYALCGLLAIDDSTDDPDSMQPQPSKKERVIDFLQKNEKALQYYYRKYPHCGAIEHFTDKELTDIYNELINSKKL